MPLGRAGCDPRIECVSLITYLQGMFHWLPRLMIIFSHRLFAEAITSGTHRGFHCIVFELCGATLYNMVNGYMQLVPFPDRHVLEIAYQLVNTVDCEYHLYTTMHPSRQHDLDLHSLGIIHTDLKLDNIAVRDQATTTVRWLSRQTGFEDKVCPSDTLPYALA